MFTASNFKRLVFFYQLILAGAGLGVAVLSLTLLTTSPILAISPKELLVGGLVLGILLMFVTALGAFGTTHDRHTPALVGYGVLMAAVVGVTIWGISAVGVALHEDSIVSHLDSLWLDSDTQTVLQIQSWGQCCGFNNYTDRIQEPCTKYAQELGCFEVMKGPYQSRLTSLLVPGTILLIGECLGITLSILLLWLVWRESRQAKLIGDRQPFDAWHKAVFQ